jgi:hypothetical protein
MTAVKNYLFNYVFNRESDIHGVIMSYIDGRYFDKNNIIEFSYHCCKIGNLYLLKYICKEYNIDFDHIHSCAAMKHGKLDVLIYLRSKGMFSFNYYGITTMIKHGYLHILQHFVNDIKFIQDYAEIATCNGRVDILIYLDQQHNIECYFPKYGLLAYGSGHISVIKYFEERYNYIPNKQILELVADNGHLDVLIYMKEKYNIICDCMYGIRKGHLHVMKYLESYINYTEEDVYCSIENGQTDIFDYLRHNSGIEINIESDDDVVYKLLDDKHLDMLLYIKNNYGIVYTDGHIRFMINDESLDNDYRILYLQFFKDKCDVEYTNHTITELIGQDNDFTINECIVLLDFFRSECGLEYRLENEEIHTGNIEVMRNNLIEDNRIFTMEDFQCAITAEMERGDISKLRYIIRFFADECNINIMYYDLENLLDEDEYMYILDDIRYQTIEILHTECGTLFSDAYIYDVITDNNIEFLRLLKTKCNYQFTQEHIEYLNDDCDHLNKKDLIEFFRNECGLE